jgi:hypothetical protein
MSWKPGRWKAICDVCGFEFKSDQLRDRWDGLKVCHKDWESRHPQDFIRARKETIVPPWTRPEPADTFDNAPACYIYTVSAYAGLATAGCAQAGVTQFPYQFLYELSVGD